MKTLYLITLTLLISFTGYSQDRNDKEKKEKIEALKVAFITERLDLTPTEAEKFWPIYNTFQAENNTLRQKSGVYRKNVSPNQNENISNEDAKKILFEIIEIEETKNKLTKTYITDLLKVLPAKKVILAISGEKEFRRKMIEEFKERHRKEKSKRN
ncbi:sensor of ECF-type sigma factor [Lacinutrix salivirga]